jgi:hypothetical protein
MQKDWAKAQRRHRCDLSGQFLQRFIVRLFLLWPLFSHDQHEDAANYNFDHPEALDFDLAYKRLKTLVAGKDCQIPTYDFALHQRTSEL